MKTRKRKDVMVSVRVTRAMWARLQSKASMIQAEHPDLTFASTVREVLRRGLEA